LLLTYAGACGIYFAYQRATRAELRAAAQRDEAELNRRRAEEASREAAAERHKVEMANASLRKLADDQRRTLYVSSMNLAQSAGEGGEPRRASEFLRQVMPKAGEEDLRGFEWHYWNRLAHLDEKTIRLAGFADSHLAPILSPDGTRVFGFNRDPEGKASRCCLWDTDTGRELWNVPAPDGATRVTGCFSPDGRRFAASFAIGKGPGPGVVRVLDTGEGRTV